MTTLVLIIGVLVALIGGLGAIAPSRLVALVTTWQGPSRHWGAVMGAKRLDAFIDWWTQRVGAFIRLWSVFALIFGLLIAYATTG